MIIRDANQVLPRLWIGTCVSCVDAREKGFTCLNVLEEPHAVARDCKHQRILNDNGKVVRILLSQAHDWLSLAILDNKRVLVHCGAGVERSPLVVATWMVSKLNLSLDEAYEWIKQHRPQVEDRRGWLL